jgi:hypothetical protein
MNTQNTPPTPEAPPLALDPDFVPGRDLEGADDEEWRLLDASALDAAALAAAGLPYPTPMGRATLPAIPDDFLPMPMDSHRVIARVQAVEDIIARVMKEGEHYGPSFPGDKKKAIQKPGVDLMCLTFGFRLEPTELPSTVRTKEFINIAVRVDVVHIATGRIVATATGSANSREEKYRWARGTGKPTCPECGFEGGVWKQREGDGFFCWRNKGGCGATFTGDDRRITEQQVDKKENDNAWEYLNTLEKMAFKRGSMAGVITACGISNKFRGGTDEAPPAAQGRRQEAPRRQAPPPPPEPPPERQAAPVGGQAPAAGVAAQAAAKRAKQEAEVALQEVKARVAECKVPAAFRLLTDELKRRGAPWFSEDIKAHLAAEFAKRFPDEPKPDAAQATGRW